MVSALSKMYAAGSKEEKRARWPTSWGYYSTLVLISQWGWGITWADGFVLACALLRRRVCFGLRRCPTCPPSNVLGYRGTPPVPPAGGCASCTLRGVGRELALAHRDASQPAPGYGYGDSL